MVVRLLRNPPHFNLAPALDTPPVRPARCGQPAPRWPCHRPATRGSERRFVLRHRVERHIAGGEMFDLWIAENRLHRPPEMTGRPGFAVFAVRARQRQRVARLPDQAVKQPIITGTLGLRRQRNPLPAQSFPFAVEQQRVFRRGLRKNPFRQSEDQNVALRQTPRIGHGRDQHAPIARRSRARPLCSRPPFFRSRRKVFQSITRR